MEITIICMNEEKLIIKDEDFIKNSEYIQKQMEDCNEKKTFPVILEKKDVELCLKFRKDEYFEPNFEEIFKIIKCFDYLEDELHLNQILNKFINNIKDLSKKDLLKTFDNNTTTSNEIEIHELYTFLK